VSGDSGGIGRRRFLQSAGAVAAGGALGAVGVAAAARAGAADSSPTPGSSGQPVLDPNAPAIPFHGTHQAGILPAAAPFAAHVSFDLTTRSRSELAGLMQTMTDRARFLTAGGIPPNLGISAPPSDSGVLGPDVPPGRLTATVALGASAFDGRFGLASAKPAMLQPMAAFADDDLDAAQCHGDLLLTLAADQQDVVLHALRDITRATRGGMQIRWRVDGFNPVPRPAGASRNLFGFKDGIQNPDTTDVSQMAKLVWAGPGEPGWAAGGSYQVVRIIRMLIEFWDRVTIDEQELMFGRRKDTGAPLSGDNETDTPNYSNDPIGATIPLTAHIRLANPRTAQTDSSRILRRGYTYDRGTDANGNLDTGLVFTCFQQDIDRQFITVQNRLADEPLVDYILPVGGGYFFAVPGVADSNDWFARQLLA
jgi:deferrochelatase/peroxidase EfeB